MRFHWFLVIGALSVIWPAIVGGPGWAGDECRDPRRVVGGQDTNIKDHPWQVALDLQGGLCGGSIVAEHWVLTAAHCFAASGQPGDVRVKAGVNNYRVGGTWTEVVRVVVHEKYDADTQENDLALIKLKTRPAGQVISLAQPDEEPQPCEELEVTGWGRTAEGGTASDNLQQATVPNVVNAVCNEPSAYDGKVGSKMMCAGFAAGGVDACQGDSGGPLVLRRNDHRPVLVGVVSSGAGCARKLKYGVYTRLTTYHDWITKITTTGGNQ